MKNLKKENTNKIIFHTTIFSLLFICFVVFLLFSIRVFKQNLSNDILVILIASGSFLILFMISLLVSIVKSNQYKKGVENFIAKTKKENKERDNFITNISHDIRTPMNSLIGFVQIADANIGNETLVKENLDKALEASDELMALFDNILTLVKLHGGDVGLQVSPLNLSTFVYELNKTLVPSIYKKNIRFYSDSSKIRTPNVWADEEALKKIFILLISYFLINIPGASNIRLSVSGDRLPDNPAYGEFSFMIEDDGMGITEDFRDRLFSQISSKRTSDDMLLSDGGVSIAIVKHLIEAMKGQVNIESKLGKGTRISLVFKFCLIENSEMVTQRDDTQNLLDFKGKKALLVDDNAVNREIAKYFLEEKGIFVEEAEDGDEAVEKVLSSAPKEYSFILMDIQMPKMDGYEATKTIRKMKNQFHASIPIIAMTANSFSDDKMKAINSGMNGYLVKPVDNEKLYAAIFEATQSKSEVAQ